MSNLTKLEEVASRMMAGMMASPTWEESTYKESSEGARLAAQALLAECAKHEPTVKESLTVAPEIPWITHDGGEMPCEAGQRVEIMFRNKTTTTTCFPKQWEWEDEGYRHNIIKWRPVS